MHCSKYGCVFILNFSSSDLVCICFHLLYELFFQYTANELSPDVNSVFLRDWRLLTCTFIWIFATLYTTFLAFIASDEYMPRGEMLLALILALLSIIIMPLFFAALISMLKPKKILLHMLYRGIDMCDCQYLLKEHGTVPG